MKKANLPEWATAVKQGVISVDAEKMYPALLDELWADDYWPKPGQLMAKADQSPDKLELDLSKIQHTEIDQYWLEVAINCAKLDIQFAIAGTELMPKQGGALQIIIKDNSKADGTWIRKNHPAGRGFERAGIGGESHLHYQRIRQLPTV